MDTLACPARFMKKSFKHSGDADRHSEIRRKVIGLLPEY